METKEVYERKLKPYIVYMDEDENIVDKVSLGEPIQEEKTLDKDFYYSAIMFARSTLKQCMKDDSSPSSDDVLCTIERKMVMTNKQIDSRLDEICKKSKREKERKKNIFNENIKSHIVYMDENGNVIPVKNTLCQNDLENLYIMHENNHNKKNITSSDIPIILSVIAFLIYCLYYWFSYLGIV